MKKSRLLHSELSHVIATLGHQDLLVICDSGLPIPKEVQRIDLALTKGIPGFLETVEVVLSELYIEQAFIAVEMTAKSESTYHPLTKLLRDVPIKKITHEQLKQLVNDKAVAVVRTGEFTPYANVILQAGVVF